MSIAPPLIGTYTAPAVKRGDIVLCLYRDRDCTVTTLSAGPIPWPRVQPRGEQGGSGLWVNDDLVRAIRTESAAALKHWFGVSTSVVWKWRKAFGVGGHATTKGSKRAIRGAAKLGAATQKAKVWTDADRAERRTQALRLGLKPGPRWTPDNGRWTKKELALLGTDHDEAIAKKLGRSRSAVTTQRVQRKIPAYSGWTGGGPTWTKKEIQLLGTDTDAAVAKRIGRTRNAVAQKRFELGIPKADRRKHRQKEPRWTRKPLTRRHRPESGWEQGSTV